MPIVYRVSTCPMCIILCGMLPITTKCECLHNCASYVSFRMPSLICRILLLQVVVVGEPKSGKTSFISSFVSGEYPSKPNSEGITCRCRKVTDPSYPQGEVIVELWCAPLFLPLPLSLLHLSFHLEGNGMACLSICCHTVSIYAHARCEYSRSCYECRLILV